MKHCRSIVARATLSLALLLCATLAPAQSSDQTPREPTPADLAGIAHVALRVHDLDASRAFYEKLGFTSPFNLTRDGAVYESFIKISDHQFIELYPVDAKDTQPGFLHVCFEGTDLEALHKYYVSQGLPPTAVRKAGAGNLLFTLAGPMQIGEAQNIEYTQYLPGSLHSNNFGKDLGTDRVGNELFSVVLVMQQTGIAHDFYAQKLGFSTENPAKPFILTLPGKSGQQVEIVPISFGHKTSITFQTANLAKAQKRLKQQKVPNKKINNNTLTLADPDGNIITVVQPEGPDLLDPLTKFFP